MKLPAWRIRVGLPLLGKELLEQAARRRTYVVRVAYAVLLFTAACLFFAEELRIASSSPMSALGRGRQMFEAIVGLQFAGIYLFMPALTCGVIAQEKEQQSFSLLLLTKLGPWTILIEKLFSRLVPMGCFLLLSLPLLAYAYTVGGLSLPYVLSAVWMLLLTMLQIGALALFCSAWYRTTVGAFVGSYLMGAAIMFGPMVLIALFDLLVIDLSHPRHVVFLALQQAQLVQQDEQLLLPFFAPVHLFSAGFGTPGAAGYLMIAVASIPILFSTAFFLVLARAVVVPRAFAPPGNLLRRMFRSLDGVFTRWNDNRLTRGISLVADRSGPPEVRPIAWRETSRRSLGQARYLFRLLVAIELPLGFICALVAVMSLHEQAEAGSVVLYCVWILAALILSVQSASLIAGERAHQTLDVLCTTPIPGREILLQKISGAYRVMGVLLVPLATAIALSAIGHAETVRSQWGYRQWTSKFDLSVYLGCTVLSAAIYLPLIVWFSFYVGLRVRSQARAIIAAVGGLVAWCILPLVFIVIPIGVMTQGREEAVMPYTLLSPLPIIAFNEYNFDGTGPLERSPALTMLLNFSLYGFALVVIRMKCLRHADRWLGRADSNGSQTAMVPDAAAAEQPRGTPEPQVAVS